MISQNLIKVKFTREGEKSLGRDDDDSIIPHSRQIVELNTDSLSTIRTSEDAVKDADYSGGFYDEEKFI